MLVTIDHPVKILKQLNFLPFKISILCIVSLCFPLKFVFASNPSAWTEYEKNNIQVYKKASPSVVYVTNKQIRRDLFSLHVHEIPQGAGSGFVWNDSGIIVTNYHVVQNADRIEISLIDQTTLDGEVIGIAPEKDLAVIRVNPDGKILSPLALGDSDSLEVGRKVLAIGNPFGLDTTLTVGIISALGREISALENRTIKDVIQTDAAINPGNSGGPLLNSLGELIGVNTAIYSPTGASAGIGFAIPVNTVKKIVPQLIKFGRIIRPIMGIEIIPDSWARQFGLNGVALHSVAVGRPAAQAGMIGISRNRRGQLILGDIIIAIDGVSIKNSNELLSLLEDYKPGDEITVTSQRKNDIKKFSVELIAP